MATIAPRTAPYCYLPEYWGEKSDQDTDISAPPISHYRDQPQRWGAEASASPIGEY